MRGVPKKAASSRSSCLVFGPVVDPSAPQRIGHLGDFGFGDIGWGKRDADLFGHGISLAIRLKRQANERMLTQGGVPFDDDANRGVYIRLRSKFTMAR